MKINIIEGCATARVSFTAGQTRDAEDAVALDLMRAGYAQPGDDAAEKAFAEDKERRTAEAAVAVKADAETATKPDDAPETAIKAVAADLPDTETTKKKG